MVTVVLIELVQPASERFVRALTSAPDIRLHRSLDELHGTSPDVIVLHLPEAGDVAGDILALRRTHPRSLVLVAMPGDGAADVQTLALQAVASAVSGRGSDDETVTAASAAVQRLSPIERHILSMIADGLTNPEIARHLGLAGQTVKNYVSALFTKLGVSRRTEAAVLFVRAGLGTGPGADVAHGDGDRIAALMRELQAGIDRIDRVADRIAGTAAAPRRDHGKVTSGSRSTPSAPVLVGHRRPD